MNSTFHATHADSAEDTPRPATLVELLRLRAATQPDRLLYTFLADGEVEEASLTCGELDARARAVASVLQSLGAKGERVLLLYPSGLEFIAAFFGCLYAGALPVPVPAPRPRRTLRPLERVAADAGAALALTTGEVRRRLEADLSTSASLSSLRWVETDDIHASYAPDWRETEAAPGDVALIQYTSGSTSEPRGVVVSHANLCHNQSLIGRAFRQSPGSRVVSWLPLYHDMGLIGTVLQPLYAGGSCYLMPPASFLQRPLRWLEAITRYRATTSGGPNFAYDLCAARADAEDLGRLDLSSWEVAFNGAEPVRASTLERFASKFADCGFRRESFVACYGLAEATLLVSASGGGAKERAFKSADLARGAAVACETEGEDVRRLVGCGSWAGAEGEAGQEIFIAGTEGEPRRDGEVGEVWVRGGGVAAGYWGRGEESARVFGARTSEGAGTYLRTGDLGFIHDGEFYVTGRSKEMLVVRGLNHYPQDIEQTVSAVFEGAEAHACAAFAVEREGEQRLALVCEAPGRPGAAEASELFGRLKEAVALEHELEVWEVVLVRRGRVPRTTSGKVQRSKCREQYERGELEGVLARSGEPSVSQTGERSSKEARARGWLRGAGAEEVEGWLRTVVARQVGVSPDEVGRADALARYGVDSLRGIELIHEVSHAAGVEYGAGAEVGGLSIARLAAEVTSLWKDDSPLTERNEQAAAARVCEAPAEFPLSYGQKALWYLHQLAPESPAYNITHAARILAELDVQALRRAFQVLVERHAALRTTFVARDGAPVQVAHTEKAVCFTEEDATGLKEEALRSRLVAEAHRPFDLERGPLMRVSLFRRGPAEHVLLLAVHHIISDFWSLSVLTRELGEAYAAEKGRRPLSLAPAGSLYSDYVEWQKTVIEGEQGARHLAFWQETLSGELPALNLPTDRPRPAVQTYRGAQHSLTLDDELSERLRALSRERGVTLYTTLLAAFNVLLQRYTGQDDILVCSPTSGRDRARWAGTVGYLVNPVVLRTRLAPGLTFAGLLEGVRRQSLEAFAHQDYPFALLAEKLGGAREASRTPLAQVMFALQQAPGAEGLAGLALNEAGAEWRAGELPLESVALEQQIAQFDLTLMAADAGRSLSLSLQYNTDLFDGPTVEKMLRHFEALLGDAAARPQSPVSELRLMDEDERRRILVQWNDTGKDFGSHKPIQQLFEEQVARTPDAPALVFEDERLTYAELNAHANRLAHRLRRLGVGPETRVALCMERSPEMVVAILGVFKAGGAYLPLDPSYPRERLAFMLEDSRAPVLLTHSAAAGSLPDCAAEVLSLDELIEDESAENPRPLTAALNAAYVIYTSGSTGTPKGVTNTHRGLCNRIRWMQHAFRLTPADTVLQKTPYTFDVSVWEFCWPLVTGASLVLARPGGHREPDYLSHLIQRSGVTVLHFVPSMLQAFLDEPGAAARCGTLRLVVCSGEALGVHVMRRCLEQTGAELFNLYGPTEASIDVSSWGCVRGADEGRVPIGRPISNTQLYVLDGGMRPVPVGVSGELHIGGVGLARGYMNRPALTAEKFVPNPFGTEPGERLYRTGDVARHLADGAIEFVGRADHQVKVRGFRVELGEVEAALRSAVGVEDCCVLAAAGAGGHSRLVAYLVTGEGCAQPLAAAEIRERLSERLPEYMVPSHFVWLDSLPLTPSGKLDRKALPAPDPQATVGRTEYVAPRTPTEELLCSAWQQVLGAERVGIYDNFFDLGGHSLLLMQMMARVNQTYGIEIPLNVLLGGSLTVAGFSEAIEQYLIEQTGLDETAELLKELDGLSDEEVLALLGEEQHLLEGETVP
jgi:amino acid adenylation domain-containing protein